MPAFPVRFDGAPAPVKPAPLLGEHTVEVLANRLGMGPNDVEGLQGQAVV